MLGNRYAETSLEWERHRHEITRLYLDQDKTLKEVQKIMQASHGFKATKRMYTTRISKWDIKKNYSAQEKDSIAANLVGPQAHCQSIQHTTFKGRDIKFQRIQRHLRSRNREHYRKDNSTPDSHQKEKPLLLTAPNSRYKCGLRATSSTGLSYTGLSQDVQYYSENAQIASSHISGQASTLPHQDKTAIELLGDRIHIPHSFVRTKPSEIILHATRSFFEVITERQKSHHLSLHESIYDESHSYAVSRNASGMTHISKFWHDFDTAVYLLKIGSLSSGWAAFHRMWVQAEEALVSDSFTLLRRLIIISLPSYFGPLPELRVSVLRFVTNFLQIKFGRKHPVVQICHSIMAGDELLWSCEAALKLLRKLSQDRFGLGHPETFENHLSLVVCQRRNQDLESAEETSRELIRMSHTVRNERNNRYYRAVRSLIHILKEKGRYQEATARCKQTLNDIGGNLSDKDRIYTIEDLAELYKLHGYLDIEAFYLRSAHLIAQTYFGAQSVQALHIHDELEISLRSQGRATHYAKSDSFGT